jgi:hypothetical protein
VTTIEFADMAAWAAWYSSEEVQESLSQLRMLTLNLITALWGPTPLMPEPLRPAG